MFSYLFSLLSHFTHQLHEDKGLKLFGSLLYPQCQEPCLHIVGANHKDLLSGLRVSSVREQRNYRIQKKKTLLLGVNLMKNDSQDLYAENNILLRERSNQ